MVHGLNRANPGTSSYPGSCLYVRSSSESILSWRSQSVQFSLSKSEQSVSIQINLFCVKKQHFFDNVLACLENQTSKQQMLYSLKILTTFRSPVLIELLVVWVSEWFECEPICGCIKPKRYRKTICRPSQAYPICSKHLSG